MADLVAEKITDYPAFFQKKVLVNVEYWNEYDKRHQANPVAVEQKREQILTALIFALPLDQAWPAVFELITNFAPFIERQGHLTAWQRILGQALETV